MEIASRRNFISKKETSSNTRFIVDELNYDRDEMSAKCTNLLNLMTDEQKQVNDVSTCNIKQESLRANLLLHTKLIIWDEAPMLKKICFKALDRTLRDLMRAHDESNVEKPFGGKMVVLGGDFRQILLVIPKGSIQDIVKATINSSQLWKHGKVLKLTANMRLRNVGSLELAADIKAFADWILQIDNGGFESNESGEADVDIPTDLLVEPSDNPILDLVNFTYPYLLTNMKDYKFFEEMHIVSDS
ncbi:uncharacterized protein LOC130725511 [Lotus japonicus]|uniref:uncharacterized protein LOC130725511 n=1 Tax=Lotus japonicus TaxID=34305 RepID=UPI0025894705|nr:uncharacterized protein LOC130725511 [Lotus japonicus]